MEIKKIFKKLCEDPPLYEKQLSTKRRVNQKFFQKKKRKKTTKKKEPCQKLHGFSEVKQKNFQKNTFFWNFFGITLNLKHFFLELFLFFLKKLFSKKIQKTKKIEIEPV